MCLHPSGFACKTQLTNKNPWGKTGVRTGADSRVTRSMYISCGCRNKGHKMGGRRGGKPQKCILSQLWRPKVGNKYGDWAMFQWLSGRIPSCSSQLWLVARDPWLAIVGLPRSSSVFEGPPCFLCVCVRAFTHLYPFLQTPIMLDSESVLIQDDLTLTNDICKELLSR